MVTHARGQVCLPLTEERADQLGLPLIAEPSESSRLGTAYTAAIDAREGITTGISAADRSHTVQVAISTRRRRPPTCSRAGMCSRFARNPEACSSAWAKRRQRSTWPASPGSTRPESSARS